jgi:hypothetical protein
MTKWFFQGAGFGWVIAVVAFSFLESIGGAQSITLGRGPELGTTAGETWFEDFQDWSLSACKALDAAQDSFDFGDKRETSRDLVAFYVQDDPAGNAVFFRVDLLELSFGAETDSLDLYVSIDFNTPGSGQVFLPDFLDCQTDTLWEVTVSLYSGEFWNIYDQNFNVLSSASVNPQLFRGAHYRSDLDAVEFGIDRTILTGQGWDGVSPLNFQAYTARDGSQDGPGEIFGASDLTDAFLDDDRGFSDGVLNGAIRSTDAARGVYYAYILHANQAIKQADIIQDFIHNDELLTPNGNPTGYARALDTAEIFDASPNLHLSGSLLSACQWASLPGNPADGPAFVQRVKRLIDGSPVRGSGALMGGVYSENILSYFEGEMNRAFTDLNEEVLAEIFGVAHPGLRTIFWIPERVAKGSTFADLAGAGYGWTVLDRLGHLQTWFGETAAQNQGNKIHRINNVNCFMIDDEADRFKFANSDDGLWFDTRLFLIEKALASDGQQAIIVFDDWEAYAGRSFTSSTQGSDNPDNWNRNVRWMANHPWIRLATLEEIAALGWTPVPHPMNANLPLETYDFLDHATEGSYDNWYFGSDLEQDFAESFPPRRSDLPNANGNKRMGHQDEPETVIGGLRTLVFGLPENSLKELALFGLAVGTFETAWHDEDQTDRCPDGAFCQPDTTFDNIAGFAKKMQFRALREAGFPARAAQWAANPPAETQILFEDVDFDGETEPILCHDRLCAFFENDGGRLAHLYARNPADGRAVQVIGNPLAYPDFEDERESSLPERNRTSALVDANSNTGNRTNTIYFFESVEAGVLTIISSDNAITKKARLVPGAASLEATYTLAQGTTSIEVQHGLTPDLRALLTAPRSTLQEEATAQRYLLRHGVSGPAVGIDFGGPGHNAQFDPSPESVGENGPYNQAMARTVETAGGNNLRFAIVVDFGEPVEAGVPTGLVAR